MARDQPDFIDNIFEFREEHRATLDEGDCFSRTACELIGPPKCLKCIEYISNFEDIDAVLMPPKEL